MLEPTQVDLCIEDPGLDVDLYVEADLASMVKVWLGDITYEAALKTGGVRLTGPRELAKAFPSWLMLSHFAKVPRPQRELLASVQPLNIPKESSRERDFDRQVVQES